jgi:c-di-GMP-binding flagellar brake protein YcgR
VLITNDERRDFRRMDIEAAATITMGNTQLQGTCKDLSSTGMLVELNEAFLNPDDIVQIVLSTHDSRFAPLDVEARIVRVNEEDGVFIVATEFVTVK